MADKLLDKDKTSPIGLDSAPGGRKAGEVAKTPKDRAEDAGDADDKTPDYIPEGFGKKDIANMGGSLKVHIRLALKVDIRITAEIKGDICIGIL